jgi:hypothetical protein
MGTLCSRWLICERVVDGGRVHTGRGAIAKNVSPRHDPRAERLPTRSFARFQHFVAAHGREPGILGQGHV